MPTAPTILPTQITEGKAPGLNYRLEGELVPVLHMALDGQVPVYFEHHVLLWKYPNMQVGLHPLKKGLKRRVFGGMPLLLLEAQSAGEIAFSRDAPGHIVALHLQPGHGMMVREHQFLAATGHVEYDYGRIKGFANMMYGGGFFVDHFTAGDAEGVVWVHGYGNVFEKVLEAGETIDIEPGGPRQRQLVAFQQLLGLGVAQREDAVVLRLGGQGAERRQHQQDQGEAQQEAQLASMRPCGPQDRVA